MKLTPLIESNEDLQLRRKLGKAFRLYHSNTNTFIKYEDDFGDKHLDIVTDVPNNKPFPTVMDEFLRTKNIDSMLIDTCVDTLQQEEADGTFRQLNWNEYQKHIRDGDKFRTTTLEDIAQEYVSGIIQGMEESGHYPEQAFEEDKWWKR